LCGFSICLFVFFFFWLQGAELMVKVNKLTSIKTQLPYSYYTLPFCTPSKIVDSAENLGEVLRGDRIENSPYAVSFVRLDECGLTSSHACIIISLTF
jgi:transmembrane 9 superfamily protein 2/4